MNCFCACIFLLKRAGKKKAIKIQNQVKTERVLKIQAFCGTSITQNITLEQLRYQPLKLQSKAPRDLKTLNLVESNFVEHLEEDALKNDFCMQDKIFTRQHQNKLPNQKKSAASGKQEIHYLATSRKYPTPCICQETTTKKKRAREKVREVLLCFSYPAPQFRSQKTKVSFCLRDSYMPFLSTHKASQHFKARNSKIGFHITLPSSQIFEWPESITVFCCFCYFTPSQEVRCSIRGN